MSKTRGEIEAGICEAIVQFEKEHMGRGPRDARVWLIDDLVLVRLGGLVTRAEHHLAATEKGRDLLKMTRMELIEKARPLLDAAVQAVTGRTVRSMHTDISTRTGERILVFVLESRPELRET